MTRSTRKQETAGSGKRGFYDARIIETGGKDKKNHLNHGGIVCHNTIDRVLHNAP